MLPNAHSYTSEITIKASNGSRESGKGSAVKAPIHFQRTPVKCQDANDSSQPALAIAPLQAYVGTACMWYTSIQANNHAYKIKIN